MTSQWLSAFKVVGIYLLVGVLWILFSDKILEITIEDARLVNRLQTLKGWIYVAVTGGLLFVLINRALEAIENVSRLDPLTMLLRHQLFHDRLEDLVVSSTEANSLGLIYLDIDHFSAINNKIGIKNADLLLRDFANALREHSRGSARIARISTDQFAIALPGIASAEVAEAQAQELRRLLRKTGLHFHVEAHCSIGIAIAPMDGKTAKALMAAASNALNTAKKSNRSGIVFFNQEVSRHESERQELLYDLSVAIERKTLLLVYQPQFSTADLSLCGVEVLLRWQHPVHGFISPDIFIPIAEKNMLISKLTAFVIEQSYTELAPMLGKEIHRVSINVSALEFSSPALMKALLLHIESQKNYIQYLQLEITETAAISNLGGSVELVAHLRQKGLRLSLDDFGTGFSSLSMLKDLSVDEIKIDRSFVFNLETQPRTQAIITALVGIANNFQISIVAEGVETQAQRQLLHELGCHELQGYLLAPPNPLDQLCSSIEQVRQVHGALS